MRKNLRKKRIISIAIIFAICVGCMSGMRAEASELTGKNISMEVKNSDLFYSYPAHLVPDASVLVEGNPDYELAYAKEFATECIAKTANEHDERLMSLIYSFQNGDYLFHEILSAIGLTDSMKEKCIDKATEQLLVAVMSNKDNMAKHISVHSALKFNWECVKDSKDLLVESREMILSAEEKAVIKNFVETQEDFFKIADIGATMIQMGTYIGFLESVNAVVLDDLIENVSDEDLLESLEKYKRYKENYYSDYIAETYLRKEVVSIIEDEFKKAIAGSSTSTVDAYVVLAELIYKVSGYVISGISGYGSAEDLLVAMKLGDYANNLWRAKNELIVDFISNPVQPEERIKYENCYNYYTAAVRAYVEATKKVNRDYKDKLSTAIADIDKYTSYEKHLKSCVSAIEKLPYEERKRVKGNRELFYDIKSGITISAPSDELDNHTIYLSEGELLYGIVLRGALQFTDSVEECHVNGDITLYSGSIHVPDHVRMQINGEVIGKRWSNDYNSINTLNVNGMLKINGQLRDYYHEYNPYNALNYTSVILEGEEAVLEIEGDVYSKANWDIRSGTIIFHGSNVGVNGASEHDYNTVGITSLGSATIKIDAEYAGEYQFRNISLNKVSEESSSAEITISQNETGNYVLSGTAAGHKIDIRQSSVVPDKLEIKELAIGKISLDVDGECDIYGDVTLGGSIVNIPGTMRVAGNMTSIRLNNFNHFCGELNLSGNLFVAGSFTDYSYVQDDVQVYTKVVLEGEEAVLEIDGDVYSRANWDIRSGTIIFRGTNVQVSGDSGYSYNTVGISDLGNAAICVESENARTIALGRMTFSTTVENGSPVNLKITQDAEKQWEVAGTATEHKLVPGRNFSVLKELCTNALDLNQVNLNVSGKYTVNGDVLLIATKVNITGNMDIAGNVTRSRYNSWYSAVSEVVVNGHLRIRGDFTDEVYSNDNSYYTNITVQGENSLLEFGGQINGYETKKHWSLDGGTIVLSGDNATLPALRVCKGNIQIGGTGEGTITLSCLQLERISGESPNLLVATDGSNYVLSSLVDGSIPKAKTLNVTGTVPFAKGEYVFGETVIGENAVVEVKDDLTLKGNLVNSGTFKMTEDHHVIVEGDFTAQTNKNQTDSFTDGVLEVKGDVIQLGDYANFVSSGKHEILLTGTDGQSISYASPAKNLLNRLVILNDSETGVTFENVIQMTGLFNHNRKQFALYKEGEGSQFIDYDKDGVTDEKDPYPMDAAISGYQMVVQPIEEQIFTGKPVEPEVTVKDEVNELLISGTHYTVTYEANDKPGDAKAIVTGIGRYKDLDPMEMSFRIICEHKYGDWIVTQEPTVDTEGSQYRECEYCKEQETEVIPKKEPEEPENPEVPEEPCVHSYKYKVSKAATAKVDGVRKGICEKCEREKEEAISRIKSITVSGKYTYNGNKQKPKFVVKDAAGNTISSSYYTVSYVTGCKDVGKHTVKVTFKTRYEYESKKTFIIRPKTPTGVSAVLSGHDDIKVSWGKATGATGYAVYYKKSTASKYSVKYVASQYLYTTLKNLSDGVKYNVKVYSYYKNGDTRYLSTSTPKVLSVYTLKQISTPTVKKSGTKVKVSWQNINGETGYQVYKMSKKNGKYSVVSSIRTSKTYYSFTATKGKYYYYKVRAYKTVDGKRIYGPWSSIKSFKR